MSVPKNRIIVAVIFLFLTVFSLLLQTSIVQALTVRTFPNTNNLDAIQNRNAFSFNSNTLKSYEWHGVSGTYDVGVVGIQEDRPAYIFRVPVSGTTTYTDFLDLYFEGVAETQDGRKLNAQVHIDSFKYEKYRTYSPSKVAVCYMLQGSKWLGFSGENSNIKVTFTTTITYADTGEVVNKELLQTIHDIDVKSGVYPAYSESWILESGFTGTLWKWSACEVGISGNKLTATSGNQVDDDASYTRAGCVAPTSKGVMTDSVLLSSNAASRFSLSLANDVLDEPTKQVDDNEKNVGGDDISYEITQKMGEFYGNVMVTYDEFTIKDVLPEGFVYDSTKVLSDGKDVTNRGTLNFDENTNTVSFTFSDAWLAEESNYSGQNIKMQVQGKAADPQASVETLENKAKITIDGDTVETNSVESKVYIPYKVSYEYVSGTDKKLPNEISTSSGEYAISDENTYYTGDTVKRVDSPAEGTQLEIYDDNGELNGTWTLSWDKEQEKVTDNNVVFTGTWTYAPAPRLILVKKVEMTEFTGDHGDDTFLFSITGEESKKTWYKSITFDKDVYEGVSDDGYYAGEDGTQFTLVDGNIYGTCKSLYLPEDDYTIKEIGVSRYTNVKSEANYHGEEKIAVGNAQDVIEIPLKLSEYYKDGIFVDYASVVFENDKTKWNGFSHNDVVINSLE